MANSHQEFSKRLRQAFEKIGVNTDSPTRLARDFRDFYPSGQISVHAVRKWLNGEAIPSQDKLVALAGWLNVSPEWLRFGTGSGAVQAAQQAAPHYRNPLSDQELIRRFQKLSPIQQQAVSEIITALAVKERRR